MTHLPPVRSAALAPGDGEEWTLQLRFGEPLTANAQMIILGELGILYATGKGPALVPEFPRHQSDIVVFGPARGIGAVQEAEFKAAATHFGWSPDEGYLPIVDQEGRLLGDMPPLPQ